jgi:hypothetical protein
LADGNPRNEGDSITYFGETIVVMAGIGFNKAPTGANRKAIPSPLNATLSRRLDSGAWSRHFGIVPTLGLGSYAILLFLLVQYSPGCE